MAVEVRILELHSDVEVSLDDLGERAKAWHAARAPKDWTAFYAARDAQSRIDRRQAARRAGRRRTYD